jgi:hypothetical protein
MVLRAAAQPRSATIRTNRSSNPSKTSLIHFAPSARSGRLQDTQRKTVANQIDPIYALQLISAEGPLATQIGGYARVLPSRWWRAASCSPPPQRDPGRSVIHQRRIVCQVWRRLVLLQQAPLLGCPPVRSVTVPVIAGACPWPGGPAQPHPLTRDRHFATLFLNFLFLCSLPLLLMLSVSCRRRLRLVSRRTRFSFTVPVNRGGGSA